MTKLFKAAAALPFVALVTIGIGSTLSGQDQAPAPARGRGAPLPPPPPQAGHPAGKLVLWGDLASYDQPATAPTSASWKTARSWSVPSCARQASIT